MSQGKGAGEGAKKPKECQVLFKWPPKSAVERKGYKMYLMSYKAASSVHFFHSENTTWDMNGYCGYVRSYHKLVFELEKKFFFLIIFCLPPSPSHQGFFHE